MIPVTIPEREFLRANFFTYNALIYLVGYGY